MWLTVSVWQCHFDSVSLTVSLWQCRLDCQCDTYDGEETIMINFLQSLSLMSFAGLEMKKKNEIGKNSTADDKTDHYSEISNKVMQPKSRKSKRKIVRNFVEKHFRNSHTFSEYTNFIRVRNFICVRNSAPSKNRPLTLLISTLSSLCENW